MAVCMQVRMVVSRYGTKVGVKDCSGVAVRACGCEVEAVDVGAIGGMHVGDGVGLGVVSVGVNEGAGAGLGMTVVVDVGAVLGAVIGVKCRCTRLCLRGCGSGGGF